MDALTKAGNLVSPALLAVLAELFPNESPKIAYSDREIWFKAGAASVVEFLEAAYLSVTQPEESP